MDFTTDGADDVYKDLADLTSKAEKTASTVEAAFLGMGKHTLATLHDIRGEIQGLAQAGDKAADIGKKAEKAGAGKSSKEGSGILEAAKGLALLASPLAALGAIGLATSADIAPLNHLMERASRIVGGALAPALDVATEAMDELIEPLQEISELVGDSLAVALDELKPIIDDVIASIKAWGRAARWLSGELELGGRSSGYRELSPRGGGGPDHDPGAVYRRVQTEALKEQEKRGGKSLAEQIQEDVAKCAKNTGVLNTLAEWISSKIGTGGGHDWLDEIFGP